MRRGAKGAKRSLGRRLDAKVRPHAARRLLAHEATFRLGLRSCSVLLVLLRSLDRSQPRLAAFDPELVARHEWGGRFGPPTSSKTQAKLPSSTANTSALAVGRACSRSTVFDEFKTHMRSTSTVLRSKTPALVEQELWGLLLAHYAVRQLMERAAWQQGLDPDRLSFVHALRVIKRKMPQAAAIPP